MFVYDHEVRDGFPSLRVDRERVRRGPLITCDMLQKNIDEFFRTNARPMHRKKKTFSDMY